VGIQDSAGTRGATLQYASSGGATIVQPGGAFHFAPGP